MQSDLRSAAISYSFFYAQHLLEQGHFEQALEATTHIAIPSRNSWQVTRQEKEELIQKIQTAQQQGTPTS